MKTNCKYARRLPLLVIDGDICLRDACDCRVLLLRQGHGPKPTNLWASRCTLPPAPVAGHGHGHGLDPVPDVSQAGTFSCRSGTGAYEYEIPSRRTRRLTEGESENESGLSVRQCNWSRPVRTNLPDAPSRTCGGRLPSGQSGQGIAIGLIGTESGQHICNPNPSSCSRS